MLHLSFCHDFPTKTQQKSTSWIVLKVSPQPFYVHSPITLFIIIPLDQKQKSPWKIHCLSLFCFSGDLLHRFLRLGWWFRLSTRPWCHFEPRQQQRRARGAGRLVGRLRWWRERWRDSYSRGHEESPVSKGPGIFFRCAVCSFFEIRGVGWCLGSFNRTPNF